MRRKPNVWVVHRPDGKWGVQRAGGDRPSKVTETQREANEIARGIAKQDHVDRITQGRNGRIVSHDSYGNDPRESKDREH